MNDSKIFIVLLDEKSAHIFKQESPPDVKTQEAYRPRSILSVAFPARGRGYPVLGGAGGGEQGRGGCPVLVLAGVPPPPLWMDKQSENITFPRTSYGGRVTSLLFVK